MRGEEGRVPPEKTTFKKPSLVRVQLIDTYLYDRGLAGLAEVFILIFVNFILIGKARS